MNIATKAPQNTVEVRVNGTPVRVPDDLVAAVADVGVAKARRIFNNVVDGARRGHGHSKDALDEMSRSLELTTSINSLLR